MMKCLFPIFLDLEGRECLVVGGGAVALRKVRNLFACAAKIKVIAPEICSDLQHIAEHHGVTLIRRKFEERDLDGVFMVFSATDKEDVNAEIARMCRERAILVNIVDEPDACTFLVPSVLRRGPLAVAVSTGGASPLWAKRVREFLEAVITEEYGEFAEMLGALRQLVKQVYPEDTVRRRQALERAVDSDAFELLLSGNKEKAKERMEQCIFSLPG